MTDEEENSVSGNLHFEDDDSVSDNLHLDDNESRASQTRVWHDSTILDVYANHPNSLTICRAGDTIVVMFHDSNLTDDIRLTNYRRQVFSLLEKETCQKIRFDMTSVQMFPSGMLGILVTVKKRGIEVELLNPSKDILEVLRVTKMDDMFTITTS